MLRFAVATLFAAGLALANSPVKACGDKFLVPGRGPQFEQAFAADQPGRILLYRNSSSEVARSVMDENLRETLQRVGHIVEVVEGPEELAKAMNGQPYDVIVADARDIDGIEAVRGPTAGNAPVMLPVVYNASWADVSKLRETFQLVLSAPSRVSKVVSLVDEAMSLSRAAG